MRFSRKFFVVKKVENLFIKKEKWYKSSRGFYQNAGVFLFNFLAAVASEDESAVVAARLLGSIEHFVDAAVSLAVLVVVRESSRVVATALEISSAGSLSRWWA